MKKYIYSKTDNIDLVIEVVFPVDLRYNNEVAASSYKGYYIPDGPLPPATKDAIMSSQAYADYRAFIEAVHDMLVDQYDLHIYYENDSPYNSFYYGVLAKNSDGSFITRFRAVFRISTHSPENGPLVDKHKKEEKDAVKKLLNVVKNKDVPRILPKPIIINNEEQTSYFSAIEKVDQMILDAVEVMERTKK